MIPVSASLLRLRRSRLLFLVALLVLAGCSAFEDDPVDVTVSGSVLDAQSIPVEGVLVTLTFTEPADRADLTTTTDAAGEYAFTFALDENQTAQVTVAATRGSDAIGTQSFAVSDTQPTVGNVNFILQSQDDDPDDPDDLPSTTSGTIARLEVNAVADPVLRVRESGGPETVALTFVARDSIGRRLSSEQSTEIRFALGLSPEAGLEVNPTSTRTNALGEATAVVSSGTQAGVIQLVAEADAADGSLVRSDPVRITIHGGHPDQAHFTVAPTIRNIPGLVRYNETTNLQVIVGDKFSNPVIPGTAVYYSTSHAVIDGATTTDASGLGSATLRSANPLPTQTDGILIVTAETAGEDESRVFGQTPVLFSGPTIITLSPQTVGFGNYDLTVADANGNPLAQGTTVATAAEGTGVLVSGFTETEVDDTDVIFSDANDNGTLQPSEVTVVTGPGRTEFPFSLTEDPESQETPAVESIVITVTSPNGNLEFSLITAKSTRPVVTASEGADVRYLPDGRIQVHAPVR